MEPEVIGLLECDITQSGRKLAMFRENICHHLWDFREQAGKVANPHHLLHKKPHSSKEVALCSSQTLVTN
jgi:hypothetical protein